MYFTDPPFGLPRGFDDPAKEQPHQGVYRRGADGRLTLLVEDVGAPTASGSRPTA